MAKGDGPKPTRDGLPDMRGRAEGSKATQFGKEDGRVRHGRPKKSQDLRTIVARIRDLPVGTSSNGQKGETVITQEGIFLAQRKKALAGDTRAAQFMQNQIDRFEVPVTDPNVIAALLEEDQHILGWALARHIVTDEPEDD